jgi:hypothetical protein
MRKSLFLHVGYHKTGTTSVQDFFWKNRSLLLQSGVLYPEVGVAGNTHANLALCLPSKRAQVVERLRSIDYGDTTNPYSEYQGGPPEEIYASLGEEIRKTRCDRILLSSECFLEWIDPDVVKSFLEKYCDCSVKIIFLVREPRDWIRSVFNQVVKDPYLRYAGKIEDLPQVEMLDYAKTINAWCDAFGAGNVLAESYSNVRNIEHGAVGAILDLLSVENRRDYVFSGCSFGSNVSLSDPQLSLLYKLNILGVSNQAFIEIANLLEKDNNSMRLQNNLPSIESVKTICSQYAQQDFSALMSSDTSGDHLFKSVSDRGRE